MTDVKVPNGNNRQLDLLAVSLADDQQYHVETSVTHEKSWRLTWPKLEKKLEAKFFGAPREREGPSTDHSRGKNYYPQIRRAYGGVGMSAQKVRRVWVTWVRPEDEGFDTNLAKFNKGKRLSNNPIRVWSFRDDILPELLTTVGKSNYDDDVLRTLSLLRQYERQTSEQSFRLH